MSNNAPLDPLIPSTSLSLLKAADGDCLFLRFRDKDACFNMLVDAGRSSRTHVLRSFIDHLPETERRIDLFLVTHIDSDHIEGAIALAKDEGLKRFVREVMFNGARHASESAGAIDLSTAQGNDFTDAIVDNRWIWNAATGGRAIHSEIDHALQLSEQPSVRAWVLGPSREGLSALSKRWPMQPAEDAVDGSAVAMGEPELDIEALASTTYERDRAIQNGSSIALLVEHAGKRILLCSDSHAETIVSSAAARWETPFLVDVATVPHHGSKYNTSPDLASTILAKTWTISTESNKHDFPNGESLARLVLANRNLRLVFNSRHAAAAIWDQARVKREFDYTTEYPQEGQDWITIEV